MTLGIGRPQPAGAIKENDMNARMFEETLAISGLYSITSTNLSTKSNGRA